MDLTLNVKKRNLKEKLKTLRKEGWLPATIYGKGRESLSVQVSHKEFKKCLERHGHKLQLNVEGKETFLVGIEEIQKEVVSHKIMHISFKSMKADEKTTLDIEIHLEGKAAGEKEGGVTQQLLHTITVKGYPQELPDSLKVSVEQLGIGEVIHVSDLVSHYNFEFLKDDHDKTIVKCQHAQVLEEEPSSSEAQAEESESPQNVEEMPLGKEAEDKAQEDPEAA